ncbi:hypothetical protein CHUAL_004612 [Chamberlinius hualienensis]
MWLIIGILMLLSVGLVQANSTYCEITHIHTMCRFVEKACPGVQLLASGVSDKDKKYIVQYHNRLRQRVATGKQAGQPAASNMKEMKWSKTLEAIAQRWADQCSFSHDLNRNLGKHKWVAQNIAMSTIKADDGLTANFTIALDMWANEVTDPGFNPIYIKPFAMNHETGHYSIVSGHLS